MKLTDISGKTILNNGIEMPYLGLGVYLIKDNNEIQKAIHSAFDCGYRRIDTAALYENEKGVGEAIKSYGLNRKDIFITTKVWNSDQGYDTTLKAFDASMKKLGLDYLDLYLVHWPVEGKYKETWRAFEKLYKEKQIRAIGVSNFMIHHLTELLKDCEVKPALNQLEYHPFLQSPELKAYLSDQNIAMEAWSPVMQGRVMDIPELQEIGEKYGKNPVQVVLRWDLQTNVLTIPKSSKPNRIRSNADIFDFALDEDDMLRIRNLNKNERIGPDPDNFEF